MDAIDVRQSRAAAAEAPPRAEGGTAVSELRLLIVLTAVFGIAYAQYPLYYLAQNEYFFYALRALGQGFLPYDWLAATGDPWPIFTRVVQLTYQYLHPFAFYIYFPVFAGLYAYSLLGIVSIQVPLSRSRAHIAAFFALFTAMHSPALSLLTRAFVGVNVRTGILEGVASQRILWDMFQPGAFGVFLLLSMLLFLRGRGTGAVVLSSVAALFHPSYVLSASALTLAYMILLYRRGARVWVVIGLGALALWIVLPAVIHAYAVFKPTSPEMAARAREILVHMRLARHADVARWFDATAIAKLSAIVGALILVRRSALFWLLLIPCGLAAVLTIAHLLTGSNALALLFPWRVSVFVVPLAVSLLLAWGVSIVLSWRRVQSAAARSVVVGLSVALLVACVGAGAFITHRRFNSWTGVENVAIMDVVTRTKAAGDTFLVPPRWRNFRLHTGAPTYVDFWFIPYNDVAVIEWDRRIKLAEAYYRAHGAARCEIAQVLSAASDVTHIVEPRSESGRCPGWIRVFQDTAYVLSRRIP